MFICCNRLAEQSLPVPVDDVKVDDMASVVEVNGESVMISSPHVNSDNQSQSNNNPGTPPIFRLNRLEVISCACLKVNIFGFSLIFLKYPVVTFVAGLIVVTDAERRSSADSVTLKENAKNEVQKTAAAGDTTDAPSIEKAINDTDTIASPQPNDISVKDNNCVDVDCAADESEQSKPAAVCNGYSESQAADVQTNTNVNNLNTIDGQSDAVTGSGEASERSASASGERATRMEPGSNQSDRSVTSMTTESEYVWLFQKLILSLNPVVCL